jgi:TonB family protein
MIRHADILDSPDSLRGPFMGAITLHVSIAAALVLYGWLGRPGESFGDRNPSGGAVGVEMVDHIPLPHEGMQNPVANESQSQVPQTAEKQKTQEKVEKPPPDAIKLRNKKAKPEKPAEKTAIRHNFVPYDKLEPNQLTTRVAPQVSNPMFSAQPGSGQVGTGPHATLGTRFAGYEAQIQSIVARNWRTGDVDAHIQTAPKVIASFELMRDGSIRNVTILQASGIPALDTSVKRAILDSNPLPPLPTGFEKDSAKVEFTFELKR